MKRILTSSIILLLAVMAASAQYKYCDASQFPVYGKATDKTEGRYERIPADLKDKVRAELVMLGSNSSGLYIRFQTNSTSIGAKWHSEYGTRFMHMADTGIRGLDLYVMTEKGWKTVGTAFPTPSGEDNENSFVSNMTKENREYLMYLSLYDGVEDLQIRIDEDATIATSSIESPRAGKQIVMYGTSILQGGCCSRPGMAFTNIIGRKLDREVINLGFSGNGRLDLEIAEVMAGIADPSIYILDQVPNCTDEMIKGRGEKFFRILRDAHPDVPVIFIDDPHFGNYGFDVAFSNNIDKANSAQYELYKSLKKQGEKKIWYIKGMEMLGEDNESFVDNVHYTDLGMMRYTDYIVPIIKKRMLK